MQTCEIYRRMCDAYGEVKRMFMNGLNMGLKKKARVITIVHGVETCKVPSAAFSKEGHADSLLGPITIDFLEKGATVTVASYCQFCRQNSPYLLNDPHIRMQ